MLDTVDMLPASAAVDLGRDLSDDDLLARILAGDLRYFESLMRRHNRRVFRAARAVVSDDAEAEDVMQEAYVLAYAALPQLQRRARFSTWIARIAVTRALLRDSIAQVIGDDVRALYGFHLERCDRVVAGALERMAMRFLESATALAAS